MQSDSPTGTASGASAHPVIPVRSESEVSHSLQMQDRSNTYVALGALLAAPPTTELLTALIAQEPASNPETALDLGWELLRREAQNSTAESVDDEYHDLFVGIGRGQVVPYGSWHMTGFLMEKPLGLLRSDLRRLGFERRADVHESEDHIASVCQVMASIITAEDVDFATERAFFNQHLAPWGADFFNELQQASAARFYRAVGNLGQSYMTVETQYLSMPV